MFAINSEPLTDTNLSDVIEPASFALVTAPSTISVAVTEPADNAVTVAVVLKPKCLTVTLADDDGADEHVGGDAGSRGPDEHEEDNDGGHDDTGTVDGHGGDWCA